VIVTTNLKGAAAETVLKVPARERPLREVPGGSAPAVTWYWKGAVPPAWLPNSPQMFWQSASGRG